MASFIRWNEVTQIWEKATTPTNPTTSFNHLPIANPTDPLDTANKAYVDSKVAGGPFVPYNGATANVNLGAFNLTGTTVGLSGVIFERSRGVAMGDWQGWNPTWKGYSSSDGVVGNGTLTASYTLVGNTVYYTIFFSAGTTTVFPGGYWMFTLPLPAANNTGIIGVVLMYKGSTGAVRQATSAPGAYFLGVASSICIISNRASDNLDSFIGPGFPWTWQVSDQLFISGQYQMA